MILKVMIVCVCEEWTGQLTVMVMMATDVLIPRPLTVYVTDILQGKYMQPGGEWKDYDYTLSD